MLIVIAGGTGFLGSPLAEAYAEEGHEVRVLTRALPPGESRHDPGTGMPGVTRVGWRPDGHSGLWAAAIDSADALVNLAGEPIADRRWTAQRKAALRDSRLVPTRSLAAAIAGVQTPPRAFLSGSGVGYYGAALADDVKTEASVRGNDFLAELCDEWEAEAHRAAARTRVVALRSGVVLEKSGGALPKMLPPFRFFAGGPLGSGRQWMSWIHRIDWIEMVRWIVDTPAMSGPVNVTAPEPVTNRDFARALGRAMHRPALIPAPAIALQLALGEMATPMLLEGQRAVPALAKQMGFHFRYPDIDQAFRGIFGD